MRYHLTKLKIAAWLCVSTSQISCLRERDSQGPDGQIIPGRAAFDFDYYEHRCELSPGKNPKDLQNLINLYGSHGWRLEAMSSTVDGFVFCVAR